MKTRVFVGLVLAVMAGFGSLVFAGQTSDIRELKLGDWEPRSMLKTKENVPEMKSLKKIDIAFLPMNLPYTMTPEMAAKAAKAFKPKILYPYHFGQTDTSKLVNLLQDSKAIEVRIRKMK